MDQMIPPRTTQSSVRLLCPAASHGPQAVHRATGESSINCSPAAHWLITAQDCMGSGWATRRMPSDGSICQWNCSSRSWTAHWRRWLIRPISRRASFKDRLVGVDGTQCSVSNTPAVLAALPKAASRRLSAAFAKLRLVSVPTASGAMANVSSCDCGRR